MYVKSAAKKFRFSYCLLIMNQLICFICISTINSKLFMYELKERNLQKLYQSIITIHHSYQIVSHFYYDFMKINCMIK
jgi:hypothetical protein